MGDTSCWRVACLATATLFVSVASAGYRFTLLPDLPGARVTALASNGLVGGYLDSGDDPAWRWTGRAYTFASSSARVYGINALGHLVGGRYVGTDPFNGIDISRAMAIDPSARYLPHSLPNILAIAYAVNDRRAIVGYVGSRAVLWEPSRTTFLPALSRAKAVATSISGTVDPKVVGIRESNTLMEWTRGVGGTWHVNLHGVPTGFTEFGHPVVSPNGAYLAVNATGASGSGRLLTYGPLRVPGMQLPPRGYSVPSLESSQANTSWGAVVGAMDSPTSGTGFFFDGRGIRDLQPFAPADVDLVDAVAVNNSGQIVGNATVAGRSRIYLATPTFRVASVDSSPATVLGGRSFSIRRTVIGPSGRQVDRVVVAPQSPSVQLRVVQLAGTEPTMTGVASPVGWPEEVAIDTNELTVGNSAIVRLEPATPNRFRVLPGRIARSGTASATVTLAEPAPRGGQIVRITSGNAGATVPGTVTVPAGQRTVTFPVQVASSASGRMFNITATIDLPDPARDVVMTAPMWVVR